jgi:CheY-like chemotaxis protein
MADAPILVIDDDPAILSTVTDILEFEGYQVEQARNGVEGLAHVAGALPRLVLLDMRMPVLDGWGFAGALRARHPPADSGDDRGARRATLGARDRRGRLHRQAV